MPTRLVAAAEGGSIPGRLASPCVGRITNEFIVSLFATGLAMARDDHVDEKRRELAVWRATAPGEPLFRALVDDGLLGPHLGIQILHQREIRRYGS